MSSGLPHSARSWIVAWGCGGAGSEADRADSETASPARSLRALNFKHAAASSGLNASFITAAHLNAAWSKASPTP